MKSSLRLAQAAWARAAGGREIIYRQGNKLMSAAVTAITPELMVARPQLLFESTYEADRGSGAANPNYDVTADGQRFVMIQLAERGIGSAKTPLSAPRSTTRAARAPQLPTSKAHNLGVGSWKVGN